MSVVVGVEGGNLGKNFLFMNQSKLFGFGGTNPRDEAKTESFDNNSRSGVAEISNTLSKKPTFSTSIAADQALSNR